jgi:ABC-type Fe3+-siderophore transport system permease subunit
MKIENIFHYVGLTLVVIGFFRRSEGATDFNLILIGISIQFIGLAFYYISKYKDKKSAKKSEQ